MRTPTLIAAAILCTLPARAALSQEVSGPSVPSAAPVLAPEPLGRVEPYAPRPRVAALQSSRRTRPGLWIPGLIISTIGVAYATGGVAALTSTPTCAPTAWLCFSNLNTAVGGALLGVGAAHLVSGLVLVGVGLTPKKDDAEKAFSPIPSISAGPGGAKLTWAF